MPPLRFHCRRMLGSNSGLFPLWYRPSEALTISARSHLVKKCFYFFTLGVMPSFPLIRCRQSSAIRELLLFFLLPSQREPREVEPLESWRVPDLKIELSPSLEYTWSNYSAAVKEKDSWTVPAIRQPDMQSSTYSKPSATGCAKAGPCRVSIVFILLSGGDTNCWGLSSFCPPFQEKKRLREISFLFPFFYTVH